MKTGIKYQQKTSRVNYISECYIGISVFYYRIVFKCPTLPEVSELGRRLNELFKDTKYINIRSEREYYKRLNGLRNCCSEEISQNERGHLSYVVSIAISKVSVSSPQLDQLRLELVKRLNKFFIENNFVILNEYLGTYSIPVFTSSDNQIVKEYEEIQLV